jgi:hypothetical protein
LITLLTMPRALATTLALAATRIGLSSSEPDPSFWFGSAGVAYPLGSFLPPDPLPFFVLDNVEMTVLIQTVVGAREATEFHRCP